MAYKLSKWDLSVLYPGYDSPELQNAFDMIEEQVTSFEGVRNKLAPDMPTEQFVDVLKASESMTRIGNKLYSFAGLSFTADTQAKRLRHCRRAQCNFWQRSRTAPCSSACGGRT